MIAHTFVILIYCMVCSGEGIHTAMKAGKIAAECVYDMFEACNFTLSACKAYGENSCIYCNVSVELRHYLLLFFIFILFLLLILTDIRFILYITTVTTTTTTTIH